MLLEPHGSFRFQYQLWTMTIFFEIAVYGKIENDISDAINFYFQLLNICF